MLNQVQVMLLAVVLFAVSPVLGGEYIGFEADDYDEFETLPNGFISADSPYAAFSDSGGQNLKVIDFGFQSDGKGLGVLFGDDSFLEIDFLVPVIALSLQFGNDDVRIANAGDLALLSVFHEGSLVETVAMEMNRDDIMNQTIAYSGAPIDFATFAYTNAEAVPIALEEVVDNIRFTLVPEPHGLAVASVLMAGCWLPRNNTW